MRVINFPGARADASVQAWNAELEAALDGDGQGAVAESWRELRADVRALAPPLDPGLERRLRAEIERRTAPAPRRSRRVRLLLAPHSLIARAATIAVIVLAVGGVAAGIDTQLGSSSRAPSTADAGATARSRLQERVDRLGPAEPAVVHPDNQPLGSATPAASEPARVESVKSSQGTLKSLPATSSAATAAPSTSATAPTPSEGPAAAPGRVQQLSATLSLATTPANVQATSDSVARLTVSAGGYVASSHVDVLPHGGEATLSLRLPSAQLGAALAQIGRLAPVRSQSQSLQDITSSYDSARRQLQEASAERSALLRALARADTEGAIDSLRGRLAVNRSEIAGDRSQLAAVSRRASDAEVEVTVLGSAQPQGAGLTLHDGLHAAGRILTGALVVLLLAAAVLIPLALVLAVLALAARAARRYRRERTLDAS